jgi:hypothetical protein
MNVVYLQRQIKNGAYNFYWIAGLSMITSIFFIFSTSPSFVVGLGVTQFMDITIHNLAQTLPNSSPPIHAIGLALDFFICSVFALFGFLASKGHRWAFISGMCLFGLDTILTLVSMDILGFCFHLFFLWFLLSGLQALNKLKQILPDPAPDIVLPKNTGE